WGEAKSRPTYQALSGARDRVYQQTIVELCEALKREAGYGYDAEAIALALSAMLEGLWLRLMMSVENVTRETALASANEFLIAAFPRHYPRDAEAGRKGA